MRDIVIGIPVFNEAGNIMRLLDSIKKQRLDHQKIERIIIYDDGSTDNLREVVARAQLEPGFSKTLRYHRSEKNLGKTSGLNYMFENTSAKELLILLDSDMVLQDEHSFEQLTAPFKDPKLGISNGWYALGKQRNLLYLVTKFSLRMLQLVGKEYPLYTCSGAIMALNGEMTSRIKLPIKMHRIDAYLYLTSVTLGFSYFFNPKVIVLEPKDLSGKGLKWFAKIQKRSTSYPDAFSAFDPELFARSNNVSPIYIAKCVTRAFVAHPVAGLVYLFFKSSALLMNKLGGDRTADKHLWRT